MKKKILVVEDDQRIAEWIVIYLNRAGFSSIVATDGYQGLELARSENPSLILLDLLLPGISGMKLCSILRQETDIPIIMLTALSDHKDRVYGLESGADDYIVKPFDPDELIARIKAVMRRFDGKNQQLIQFGPLELDDKMISVSLEGKKMVLSRDQFSLLSVFMRHQNQVLSRKQLISLAFGDENYRLERTIDTHVRRLRKIIHEKTFQPIQTVYGIGYKFGKEEK